MARPAYDPDRPWAQTDALIIILAQNLHKTYSQYLQITGAQPTETQNDELFAPHVQSSAHNPSFRPLAPRPILAATYASQGPAPLDLPLPDHTAAQSSSARPRSQTKRKNAPVASPFFEDPGDSFSIATKNSNAAAASGSELSASLMNQASSMAPASDMDGFPQTDYMDEPMQESHFDSSIPIDPNLTSRGGYENQMQQNQDGPNEAVHSDVIDPTLMLLNRQAQAGPSYYAPSQNGGGYYRNDQNLGARFNPGMPKRLKASPFFADRPNAKPNQLSTNRTPGSISCIPFPTLEEDRFGIIQEELADDPFLLLIAVTFLIKTKGAAAIPTFRLVIQRFPTHHDLANPANTDPLTQMIHHLGLSGRRVKMIQSCARDWLECPPTPHARYTVRNYTQRELDPTMASPVQPYSNESETHYGIQSATSSEDLNAWEIGHLTQGRYAIDSWRIFCRDKLLGKALDWKGAGAPDNFQPEWMRVLPQDKELRACLRWMWMKEGWEWDPKTGSKQPLREEMRKAVNERRVSWNCEGDLVITSDA